MKFSTPYLLVAIFVIACIFPVKGFSTTAATDNQNEFEMLMQKIRLDFAQNPNIEAGLKRYNETDGSFNDIDYSSIQRTKWPPLTHIDRLYDFAFAYTNPQNKYYKNDAIFAKIEKGLEFWHERNPWCHNWWYNQIAEPQQLGILLIQMRSGAKQLPSTLENKLLERIRKDCGHPAKWTGANRTDIALHWIYRACLTENETDLNIALDNIYNPITYTTQEGFQHDNSYFQHGQQLYIGGYGDEILKGVTQVASYTKDTKYAIPENKLAMLSKFMRETYYATIRGQYMLFDALGRGVSRPNVTNKASTALFAKRMVELDTAHANEFRAIIERLNGKQPANYSVMPKHTHYFRGDYTLHVRPDYTFDVRMVSNRTMRCEYGNGENLKTYFMSDGGTNIVVDGDEYTGIFPVWNWARIPGTTAPQLNEIPKAKSDWQTPGTSTFAGGVSDSIYGVSAYSYIDTYAGVNTEAHKAWFFFDEEVVCLGAGIQSSSLEPVFTTINQCLLSGKDIILSENRKQSTIASQSVQIDSLSLFSSPEWILHNEIGYLFPKGGNIFVCNQIQTGNWFDINNSASKDARQEEVFTVGFNHGKSPLGTSYAYIVLPGKQSAKEMKAYKKKKNIEISENTKNLQVVKNKSLGIWQMVFYQAGEFKSKELTVKVDKGCALIIKDMGKQKIYLHIADPGQTQSKINVSIHIPTKSTKVQSIDCDFRDSGIYAGASQAHRLLFQ